MESVNYRDLLRVAVLETNRCANSQPLMAFLVWTLVAVRFGAETSPNTVELQTHWQLETHKGRIGRRHCVRSGKSNVHRSGPIAGLNEILRTKLRRRNATRAFVLMPNDSMRESWRISVGPPSLRGTARVHQLRPQRVVGVFAHLATRGLRGGSLDLLTPYQVVS
jgi:hypothetical protein